MELIRLQVVLTTPKEIVVSRPYSTLALSTLKERALHVAAISAEDVDEFDSQKDNESHHHE